MELLAMIFSNLSQYHLYYPLNFRDEALEEANRNAQRNIRSLCLTSRRADLVARPLLFHTITITSPATLLLLWESLQKITKLGCYIKQLRFEMLLAGRELEEFLPLPSADVVALLVGWDGLELTDESGNSHKIHRRNTTAYSLHCRDQIISACYFDILCKTPRLHSLGLRILPVNVIHKEHVTMFGEFRYASFFRKVEGAISRSTTADGNVFLPKLKALELLGDRQQWGHMLSIDYCEPLLRLPTLERISCFHTWASLRGPPGLNLGGAGLHNQNPGSLQ
jgi:hypothetical protein